MVGIIAFIFVFGVVVVVHEFGHFYVAKKSGVRVREFAIGMGPKLFQTRRNGTTYTIRVLPVGGYVRMAGRAEMEDSPIRPGMTAVIVLNDVQEVTRINLSETTELVGGQTLTINAVDLVDALTIEGYLGGNDEELVTFKVDHDATIIESDGTELLIAPRDTHLESAKLWQRAAINFAGPFMNFVLAVVLFVGLAFAIPGVTTTTIDQAQKNMPAYQAGLRSGDTITKINDVKISSWQGMQNVIQTKPGKQVKITYTRKNVTKVVSVKIKTLKNQGQKIGQIGITAQLTKSIGARLQYGINTSTQAFTQIFTAIKNLISAPSLNQLGGPVSIYKTTSTVSTYGFLALLSFMAWLSVNLGLLNLFPIPALDGGKLVLNLIEAIIRRPIPDKVETGVTIAGAILLVILMVAVTGNDIVRYFIK
ncbi:MAG: RIP metalloprotease RseP [Lactobacillaceae bacterium]|nr:RIP metalloprotease RseP [Lactobacillaceae bacterium]